MPGLPEEGSADAQRAELIQIQHRAQRASYASSWGEDLHLIVLDGSAPVGRLWLGEAPGELRVVDLALLPAAQGHGIGGPGTRLGLLRSRRHGEGGACGCAADERSVLGGVPAAGILSQEETSCTCSSSGVRSLATRDAAAFEGARTAKLEGRRRRAVDGTTGCCRSHPTCGVWTPRPLSRWTCTVARPRRPRRPTGHGRRSAPGCRLPPSRESSAIPFGSQVLEDLFRGTSPASM